MLVFIDILSDADIATDSYPSTLEAGDAVIAIESKQITVGDEDFGIGANVDEDAEEGATGESGSEAKKVINLVNAHSLQTIKLSKKEYKAAQKSYWKGLLKKIKQKRYAFLFNDQYYEPPADKKEAKAAEQEAIDALGKYDRPALDGFDAQISNFKKNFPALEAFVKDTVLENFDEFDFYLPQGGVFGECIIIPARYIGAATAPIFFIFADGIIQKKE